MELNELSHEQQLALVALVEEMASVDRMVTEEEGKEIGGIAEALGDDAYRALLDESERRFANEDQLRAVLAGITDQQVRETIYETALEVADAEPPVGSVRSDLLDWLAKTWNIEVDIQEEGESQA